MSWVRRRDKRGAGEGLTAFLCTWDADRIPLLIGRGLESVSWLADDGGYPEELQAVCISFLGSPTSPNLWLWWWCSM